MAFINTVLNKKIKLWYTYLNNLLIIHYSTNKTDNITKQSVLDNIETQLI